MCGRAACTLAPSTIEKRYNPKNGFRNVDKFVQSFNISPFGTTSCLPVVSRYQDASREINTDVSAMRWGLIPVWQKDVAIKNNDAKLFNARIGRQCNTIDFFFFFLLRNINTIIRNCQ